MGSSDANQLIDRFGHEDLGEPRILVVSRNENLISLRQTTEDFALAHPDDLSRQGRVQTTMSRLRAQPA